MKEEHKTLTVNLPNKYFYPFNRIALMPTLSLFWQGFTDRDWTEDLSHENGNYTNKCFYCEQNFLGHKRRIVCRKCQLNSPVDIP
jgi:hypothetical protein